MTMKIKPHTMRLLMLAGWINRHQQEIIEDLKTEYQILQEILGKNACCSTIASEFAWPSRPIS